MYVYFAPHDKLHGMQLVFLSPAEALWAHFKISIVVGLMLSFPILLHQAWKFISPGLLPKEKRYAFPFISLATVLFLFGIAFCFFIVLPFAIGFLLTFKVGDFLTPMLSIGRYIAFILTFILAFGLIFELPVVIFFLTKVGIVTPAALARNRKYAVLAAFIVAAFLTPTPDIFNQLLMAIPIILLYEMSIWISPIFAKKRGELLKKEGSHRAQDV